MAASKTSSDPCDITGSGNDGGSNEIEAVMKAVTQAEVGSAAVTRWHEKQQQ